MCQMLQEYRNLMKAIIYALEVRDCYTVHHSIRVSNMVEIICTLLKLSAEAKAHIHIAADVHDIGKIGVPDQVLCKGAALTEEEWKAMRKHPENGAGILAKVRGFDDIAEIVRYHHEHWDGKGYPDGLVGEAIPVGARIIIIADSIDAMLSDRYYRKKLTQEQCRLEIRKNSGIIYDPQIASMVLEHWEEVLSARTIDELVKRILCQELVL